MKEMLECPFYNELSKIFIKPCYWKILNIPKFIELMTTEKKLNKKYIHVHHESR